MRNSPVFPGLGPLLGIGLILALAGEATAQDPTSVQFERRSSGQASMEVEVRFGAGEFSLAPARAGHLYRATFRYREDSFTPSHEYGDGRLSLGLEGRGTSRTLRGGNSREALDLRLSPDVPQSVRLEMGAVQASLELGGIALRRLDLSTGASETRIEVSHPNPVEMDRMDLKVGAASLRAEGIGRLNARTINVEAGVGEVRLGLGGLMRAETEISASFGIGALEVRIPEGIGVRLTRSSFLSPLTSPFLEERGGAYYSADWDGADRRVRIHVDSAFGSVRILRGDG